MTGGRPPPVHTTPTRPLRSVCTRAPGQVLANKPAIHARSACFVHRTQVFGERCTACDATGCSNWFDCRAAFGSRCTDCSPTKCTSYDRMPECMFRRKVGGYAFNMHAARVERWLLACGAGGSSGASPPLETPFPTLTAVRPALLPRRSAQVQALAHVAAVAAPAEQPRVGERRPAGQLEEPGGLLAEHCH